MEMIPLFLDGSNEKKSNFNVSGKIGIFSYTRRFFDKRRFDMTGFEVSLKNETKFVEPLDKNPSVNKDNLPSNTSESTLIQTSLL
jgi:hypothetical protein